MNERPSTVAPAGRAQAASVCETDSAGRSRELLEDHAVTLRQAQQGGDLLLLGVALELEAQADRLEAHRGVPVHRQGAPEVEVALRAHRPAHLQPERGCDRLHRDSRAGDQRLQQHVPRARQRAVAAGGRVQAGLYQGPSGVDAAGDAFLQRAVGFEARSAPPRAPRGSAASTVPGSLAAHRWPRCSWAAMLAPRRGSPEA